MKYFIAATVFVIALGMYSMPLWVEAQSTNYTLLAPIPLNGPGAGNSNTTTAAPYIQGIFTLTIAIAGVLAVVMIIFGGIKYMSTDAFEGKSEAKSTIQNALVGLLLAMSAWLILYTINPRLVSFQLSVKPQAIPTQTASPTGGGGGGGGGGVLPGYPLTSAQVAENESIRQTLANNNVTVNAGPCANGGTSGCTNLVGLPSNAISGVTNLAASCNCSVVISGGSEGGHETHGPNVSNMDIRRGSNPTLDNYITSGQPTTASCGVASAPKYRVNGAIYTNEGDHWHACY